MRIMLAALGFRNGDTEFNKNKIISAIEEYSKKSDLILLGETFLQGFNSLTWNYDRDKNMALSRNDKVIEEIRTAAKENKVCVSFGYLELEKSAIFSSQIVIDKTGAVVHNYRRVSEGWKIPEADFHYKEGRSITLFELEGKKLAIGLCGDLWYEENVNQIARLDPDIVLWSVYTDYNFKKWNNTEKYEYAKQVKPLRKPTVYVISYCLDDDGEEVAKGGAALFFDGNIIDEIPSGKEGCIIVEI